jgi:hypothetical protein
MSSSARARAMNDEMVEALARDAAKLESLGQPSQHLFAQSREGKVEQCVCGHMLEHWIHDVDLRPYGIEF